MPPQYQYLYAIPYALRQTAGIFKPQFGVLARRAKVLNSHFYLDNSFLIIYKYIAAK
jgi:hypothetical protein